MHRGSFSTPHHTTIIFPTHSPIPLSLFALVQTNTEIRIGDRFVLGPIFARTPPALCVGSSGIGSKWDKATTDTGETKGQLWVLENCPLPESLPTPNRKDICRKAAHGKPV